MKTNKTLISTLLGAALLAIPITAAAGSTEYTGNRFTLPALAQTYTPRVNSEANLMLIHDHDDWRRRHHHDWRWRDRDDWYEHNRGYWRDRDWKQRYYAPVYRDDDCRVGRRYYPYRYWQRDF